MSRSRSRSFTVEEKKRVKKVVWHRLEGYRAKVIEAVAFDEKKRPITLIRIRRGKEPVVIEARSYTRNMRKVKVLPARSLGGLEVFYYRDRKGSSTDLFIAKGGRFVIIDPILDVPVLIEALQKVLKGDRR